ncbi:hypothetical protein GF322_01690 [Candidatus Dependentiae bacterium]|nr:hypothetical protein [Candidatus Dependentiae bacterium]
MDENKILRIFFVLIFIFLFYLKTSCVFCSTKFFFFSINFIMPLIGLPFAFFLLIKNFVFSQVITFGLPTFFSTLTFFLIMRSKNKNYLLRFLNFSIRVILPVLFILSFILHPVGKIAYIYSFYWLIPILLYFFEPKSYYNFIFNASLTSTFLAHAFGSIIWLYTSEMNAIQWLKLIPIVAIERLVFASGTTIIYFLAIWFKNKVYLKSKMIGKRCLLQLN